MPTTQDLGCVVSPMFALACYRFAIKRNVRRARIAVNYSHSYRSLVTIALADNPLPALGSDFNPLWLRFPAI